MPIFTTRLYSTRYTYSAIKYCAHFPPHFRVPQVPFLNGSSVICATHFDWGIEKCPYTISQGQKTSSRLPHLPKHLPKLPWLSKKCFCNTWHVKDILQLKYNRSSTKSRWRNCRLHYNVLSSIWVYIVILIIMIFNEFGFYYNIPRESNRRYSWFKH